MYPIIKNKCRPDVLNSCFAFLILAAVLFPQAGCVTRERGCLDIAAANFDLDADRACDDCCVYPVATLTLTQHYDSLNFNVNDTLFDIHGMPYRIRDMKYILSDWSWTDDQDRVFTVDSADFICATGNVRVPSDIILVDTRQFIYNIGSFRLFPKIDSLYFTFGFPAALDCVDPGHDSTAVVLSEDSPVYDSVSMSRAAVRMIIQRDLMTENVDTVFVHTRFDMGIPYDFQFVSGFDPKIRLTVEYSEWFSEVDVNDISTFRNSVRDHAALSFSRTP